MTLKWRLATAACLLFFAALQPAHAQNVIAKAVTTCGTQTYIANNPGPLTVDLTGKMCTDVTAGSGGAVTNAGTFAVQAAQSGTWTVQPGNTANTTAWKVDGSAVTQPVSIATAPLQPLGITPTDRTITSATGSSQTVMSSNATRHSLIIQNTGSFNCGINPTGGTAAIGSAGTLTLVPQGSYQPRVPTLTAVTAICTAAQPLYAEEN